MDVLARRRFLLASGVVAGGAIAGTAGLRLGELLRSSKEGMPDGPGQRATTLVLVTLYGGNDGLNTVVPYADPAYHSARPELAYPPEHVLHLSDSLGLNRAMRGLRQLWDDGHLAIVLGVGYPKPDRSHFRSMDIWQTASPGRPINTGWVGRWLDGTKAPAEAAISFEPVLPPLLCGETRAGACIRPGGVELPANITADMIAALGRSEDGEPQLQSRAAAAFRDLLRVDRLVGDAEHGESPPEVADEPDLPATGTGGEASLAAQLNLVARCVEAAVPTRVYSVSMGGFDTHADERATQEKLLRQVDESLSGFVRRMAKTGAGRQVTVVVYSEFGRRVRANASDGTDHGTAGPVFVMGTRVAGGFFGEQPSLSDLDAGDLKPTTDFRDIFGTVLHSVLQADPTRYLEGYQPTLLPLLTAD